MKKYTIGLITGALLGISAMMFMGATKEPIGRYQLTGEGQKYMMLDTVYGTLYTVSSSISDDMERYQRWIKKVVLK